MGLIETVHQATGIPRLPVFDGRIPKVRSKAFQNLDNKSDNFTRHTLDEVKT